MKALKVEYRGDESACICESCHLPFLTIENGELLVISKHGSQRHENIITLEQLRMIAFEMYRQKHPPEIW